MSKINKIKSVVIMLLASVLMFTASAFVMNAKPQTTFAEGEKVFVMSDEVQARMSSPAGLRFTTYLSEEVKAEAEAADEFGMIIAPAVNFDNAESADYLADGALVDKVIVDLDASKLTLDAESGAYFINAVLYNIQEKNWYLDFAAVAYYKTGDVATYATNEVLPRANIGDIVEKAFFDEAGDSETRGQLLENFNYGGMEAKEVAESQIGGVTIEAYTIPAHAIPVNNDNVVFVVTLPENAYSFKLTESVAVNNQHIQEGSANIIAGFDAVLMNSFDGILDGNGYDFVISIHTNNRPTRGVFAKDLNGTIKNLNLIVRAETWSSGNYENGSIIWNLNGTIENCVISAHTERFGSTNWTLNWAMIESTTADAVIVNSVFNNIKDMATKFIRTAGEGTTVANVAIVNDKAWTEAMLNTIQLAGVSVEDLYLYNSPAALIAGTPVYKYDGMGIVATDELANIGLDLALVDVKVRGGQNGQNADGIFTDVEETLNVPVLLTEETATRTYVVVDNAADLVAAIRAQKDIILASDIVINNKNANTDDKVASVIGHVIENEPYRGTLDGNGYTLNINIGGTTRSNGVLFLELNGTVKNLNAVISFEGWGSGNWEHLGAFIGTLNGTVENCVVTVYNRRFGNSTLTYSPIQQAGANAVVKNSVFYNAGPINTGKLINKYTDDINTAIIENVIVIDNAWTTDEINTMAISTNMQNVYLVDGVANAVAGQVAYAFNGSAFVASSDVINVKEVLGYNLSKVDASIRYIAYNNGEYGIDTMELVSTVVKADASKLDGVVADVAQESLVLDPETSVELPVVVTKDGETFNSAVLSYVANRPGVVSVMDGKLTAVAAGDVTVTVSYYGQVLASFKVTVNPKYITVTTAEDFYTAVQNNEAIRLGADITIKNNTMGGIASYHEYLANTFNGIIDGQGYSLTVITTEDGRPKGGLFITLNGTIKNTNIVIVRSDWGDGTDRYVGFVTNLNGTIENCSISSRYHRFGQSWKIIWSFVENMSATAVIKNTIFNNLQDLNNLIPHIEAGATVENVAFVSPVNISTLSETLATTGSLKNVYLYSSVANLLSGVASYEVKDGAVVAATGTVNVAKTFGYYMLISKDVTLNVQENATVLDKTFTVPVIVSENNMSAIEWTTVETAADLYAAIAANKFIKLAADITIKNTYYSDGGVAGVKTILADTFSGYIDGQGYTLTVMISNLRPAGGLFVTLNGTLKNLNVVLLRSDWGDGTGRHVGLVTNLNGTIDNCVFTVRLHRWNYSWNIVWAFVENVSADAVIKNTVFNASQSDLNGILTNVAEGATIENVAFVLPLAVYYDLVGNFNLGGGNYKNVYFFSTVSNLANGAASSVIVDGAIADATETVDVEAVFGAAVEFEAVTYNVQQKASDVDNGEFVDVTIDVPKFVK